MGRGREVAPGLLAWGTDISPEVIEQAERVTKLPFIAGHVALMPDAHVGIGATVGSVIPTEGAIIPAAVGVDIGCGMVASKTSLTVEDLPDSLDSLMPLVEERIPAGVGKGHADTQIDDDLSRLGHPCTELTTRQRSTVDRQFGTLGSGNHFVEVCRDEEHRVWTLLHSGSRGIGNQLARYHIDRAKALMKKYFIKLEDPDLAYVVQGTPEFTAYIEDMLWAQRYAMASRERMNKVLLKSLFEVVGHGEVVETINCHHNFSALENYYGKGIWVTRKGAIKAAYGDRGVIPGSMGTESYVVTGLGSYASYQSCAHGAGRRMSRTQARQKFTGGELTQVMGNRVWNADRAALLVDEHPDAYKDIQEVMANQSDLVRYDNVLRQIFNYKG